MLIPYFHEIEIILQNEEFIIDLNSVLYDNGIQIDYNEIIFPHKQHMTITIDATNSKHFSYEEANWDVQYTLSRDPSTLSSELTGKTFVLSHNDKKMIHFYPRCIFAKF